VAIIRQYRALVEVGRDFFRALYSTYKNRPVLGDLETLCVFVGYPRSGHSVIGAALDAHPDMMIAHELGLFRCLHLRFPARAIYSLLIENSRKQTVNGRRVGSYSYEVEGQWQGSYRTLKVIGDKHGEGASRRLMRRPWLLTRLRQTFNLKIRMIHVIRNPYDNISTICAITDKWRTPETVDSQEPKPRLRQSIGHYFSLCNAVSCIKTQLGRDEFFELRHEDFIMNPKHHLRLLCRFLGCEASNDYLNACASIVFDSPHQTRYRAPWDSSLIKEVEEGIRGYQHLQGYSFDG
jgi:hypothetical protein